VLSIVPFRRRDGVKECGVVSVSSWGRWLVATVSATRSISVVSVVGVGMGHGGAAAAKERAMYYGCSNY
jgi:hypothetical protein